ncbi:MAG: domain 2 [Verrucomicrobiota bacterium]
MQFVLVAGRRLWLVYGMSDQWHLLQQGQQYGPYTGDQLVEFAKEGRVVRESMLWAEGMADWVPASQIEGLFPPAPVAAAPARATPGARMAGRPAPVVGRSASASVYQAALGAHQVAALGGNYPPVGGKAASFGLLGGLLGGGVALLGVVGVLAAGGAIKSGSLEQAQLVLLLVLLIFGGGGILMAVVLQAIYLARLWSCLRYGRPRTTPGKAVGFLLLRFFNLYWIFVAFLGLAQDWNRITREFVDLQWLPRMSEGIFLAFCIGVFVPPLAFVMWFPVMSQICRSINAIAFRPVHRLGTVHSG